MPTQPLLLVALVLVAALYTVGAVLAPTWFPVATGNQVGASTAPTVYRAATSTRATSNSGCVGMIPATTATLPGPNPGRTGHGSVPAERPKSGRHRSVHGDRITGCRARTGPHR